MIVDLTSWLARLRPGPPVTPLSRDAKFLAARRSRRLAEQQARRQSVLPVRITGAGVVIHSRFRRPSHV